MTITKEELNASCVISNGSENNYVSFSEDSIKRIQYFISHPSEDQVASPGVEDAHKRSKKAACR